VLGRLQQWRSGRSCVVEMVIMVPLSQVVWFKRCGVLGRYAMPAGKVTDVSTGRSVTVKDSNT
jgi:hypothetical protein